MVICASWASSSKTATPVHRTNKYNAMQFPESWLREFCNPALSSSELADTLTMGGLEVEDSRPVAPPFTKIVVGEIKEAVQHPNADRLRVCQVDVGQAD